MKKRSFLFFFIFIIPSLHVYASIFPLKGVHYVSWLKGEYSSGNSDISIQNFKNDNGNFLTILVTWYQDQLTSTTIYSDSALTPTDSDVREAIRDAHSKGLSVMLKPHVDVKTHAWRGDIDPSDKDQWFASYTHFMTNYARIAQEEGVEILCMGCELKKQSTASANTNRWKNTINAIRRAYSAGPLTYAANHDEYNTVVFWKKIDAIGIDAYFPLSTNSSPSLALLKGSQQGWYGNYQSRNWVNEISRFQSSNSMPLLFTEIGCCSHDYATKQPWYRDDSRPYNGAIQSNYFRAAIETWQTNSFFWGIAFWDWMTSPSAGGAGDIDFTPQNKPAEGALRTDYADNSLLLPTPVLSSPGNWDTKGTNVIFSWNDLSSQWIWKYQVQIAPYNDYGYASPILSMLTRNTSVTQNIPNGDYRWRVRVFKGKWSLWSEERFLTVISGGTNQVLYNFEEGGVNSWNYDNTTGSGIISSPTNSTEMAVSGTHSIKYNINFQNGTLFDRYVGVKTNINLTGFNYLILRIYFQDPPDQATLNDFYDNVTLKAYVKTGAGWTTYESAPADEAKARLGSWSYVYISLAGAANIDQVHELGVHVYSSPGVAWNTKVFVDYVLVSSSVKRPDPIFSFDSGHLEGWKNDTTAFYSNNIAFPTPSTSYAYDNNYSLSAPLTFFSGKDLSDIVFADCQHYNKGWSLTNYGGIEAYAYIPSSAVNQVQAQIGLKHGSSWSWAEGTYAQLKPGKWRKIYCDFKNMTDGSLPVTISRSNIKEIGVRLYQNGTSVSAESTTLYIDAVRPIILAPPGMVQPGDESTETTTTPTFQWSTVSNADSYHLQVSRFADFSSCDINQTGIVSNSLTPASPLQDNQSYYWRVRAYNNVKGFGTWSDANHFLINTGGTTGSVLYDFEGGGIDGWSWDNGFGRGTVSGPANTTSKAYHNMHSIYYDVQFVASDYVNRALRVVKDETGFSNYRGLLMRVYIPRPPTQAQWDDLELKDLQFSTFIKTGSGWVWYESALKHISKAVFGGWVDVYMDFKDARDGGGSPVSSIPNLNNVRELGVKMYVGNLSGTFTTWDTRVYVDYVLLIKDPHIIPLPTCNWDDGELWGWKSDNTTAYSNNLGLSETNSVTYHSTPYSIRMPLTLLSGHLSKDAVYKRSPWSYSGQSKGWDMSAYKGLRTYVYLPAGTKTPLVAKIITKMSNFIYYQANNLPLAPGKWKSVYAKWGDFGGGFNPARIYEVGLEIYNSSASNDSTYLYMDDFLVEKLQAPVTVWVTNNIVLRTNKALFKWTKPDGASSYDLEIASDPGFNYKLLSRTGLGPTNYLVSDIFTNGNYYWHVRAYNGTNYSTWCDYVSFQVNFTNLFIEPVPGWGINNASIAWGDFNNDGNLDIAVAGYDGTSRVFRIYKNNGDGTFNSTPVEPEPGWGVSECSIACADFNNDGNLDIAVAGNDGSGRRFRIYKNIGNCIFDPIEIEPKPGWGLSECSLAWKDFNNDGSPDIACAGFDGTGYRLRIYKNMGNGSFDPIGIEPEPGWGVADCSLAWGDFNNDGTWDLAVAGYDGIGHRLRIYKNLGNNSFDPNEIEPEPGWGVRWCSLAWGDFDRNGILDLAVAGRDEGGTRSFRVYKNNGDGTFNGFTQPEPDWGVNNCSVNFGDLNQDGDPDLAVTGFDGTANRFRNYLNQGTGTFSTNEVLPDAGWYGYKGAVCIGDYNNDGRADIAVAGEDRQGRKKFRIYKNIQPNANSAPTAPGNLSATNISGKWRLRWRIAVSDDHTPDNVLRFKVAIGTNTSGLYNYSSSNFDYPSGQADLGNVSLATARYYQTTISAGRKLYWKVSSIDTSFKNSSFSPEQLVSPTIPARPQWISAIPVSANQIDLSWHDLSNETGYTLFRNILNNSNTATNLGLVDADITNKSDTGLAGGMKYFYWLKALNQAGSSGFSSVISNTTFVISPPVWISAVAIQTNQMSLLWHDLPNETGYTLFRNTMNNAGTAMHLAGFSNNRTNYNDTGLVPGQEYFYWLKAYSNTVSSPFSTVISNRTFVLLQPQWSGARAFSTNRIDLVWHDIPNETSYTLYRNTISSTNSFQKLPGVSADITNYSDTGLQANRRYYYWIKAFSSSGSSVYSPALACSTLPAPPQWSSMIVIPPDQVDLSWRNMPNETAYTLFRDTAVNPAGAVRIKGLVIDQTNFIDIGLTQGLTYYYWLKVYNLSGGSDFSLSLMVSLPLITKFKKSGVYPTYFNLAKLSKAKVFCGGSDKTVTVRIYDIAGNLVKDFKERNGKDIIEWDGTLDSGQKVYAGVFILHVSGGGINDKAKFIIVK